MHYKHAPKTCRNFVELARRQYYDNVIFHRIIKDFIVQGGDPTGTGRGGESIYAVNMLLSYRAKFEDEIKSELKHIGAGILSMANAGPNTNGRQFFVTLAPCQSLDGKHTIFRRVCRGMEIVKRLGSVQTDKNDSGSQHALPMEAHAHHHHHLRQLRAALLRRGHPIPSPPAAHPDPERAHLAAIRAATASGPILTLAACACLRRAGLPPPGPRALPALLRSAARCDGAGAYVAGAHAVAARVGALGDAFVGTALVGAYAACGCVGDARRVFDGMPVKDVVSWGVMLDSYCQTRNYKAALVLFAEMKRSGVVPDQLIIATALSACGHIGHWRTGKAIHSYMLVSDILINPHLSSALINFYANCAEMDMAEKLYYGMLRKDLVSSTAMVFGYAKNRKVEVARSIFNGMPEKDVVSWSAMISGYAESNQPNEALRLFNDMQEHGVRPDEVTVLSVISACANLGSLDKASWVHSFTENNGFTRTLHICNALIDMFAKCGDIILAFNIFNKMPHKNVITWTSMITAFAMHGDGKSALVLFEQMKNEGVEPNKVTFLNLLYACCHAGLVHEGRLLFKCMVQEYRIEPNHEHYGCMVDLLGRSKLLQEAVDLIESMHLRPNEAIWGSLLAACWMHDDLKLAAFAAKRVLELDPNHDGAYVLLSKIYMKSGSWNDGEEVRGAMKLHGVTKETGSSWMELINPNYGFAAGGGIHPESNRS